MQIGDVVWWDDGCYSNSVASGVVERAGPKEIYALQDGKYRRRVARSDAFATQSEALEALAVRLGGVRDKLLEQARTTQERINLVLELAEAALNSEAQ